MQPSLFDEVTRALHAVLAGRGWQVATRPDDLRAALYSALGPRAQACQAIVDAFVISVHAGLPDEVRTFRGPPPTAAARLAPWGVTPDLAEQLVRAWVSVLPGPPPPRPNPFDAPTMIVATAWQPTDGGTGPVSAPVSAPASTPASAPAPAEEPSRQWNQGRPHESPSVPPPLTPPPPGGQQYPAAPAGGGSKRTGLIVGLAAVLVAGIVTAVVVVASSDDEDATSFAFNGKRITNADTVLTDAQRNVEAVVARRHGAKTPDTRCYFAADAPPKAGGTAKVSSSLYCGPVQFVDGDADRTFAVFGTKANDSGDMTALTVAKTPNDQRQPPYGQTLVRPDGQAPPDFLSLDSPAPPPAAAGSVTAETVGTLAEAPAAARMGSYSGSVRIATLGTVTRYGKGDDARSAPTGGRLIAFTLDNWYCDFSASVSECRRWEKLPLHVDVGGASRASLPELPAGEAFVVAVGAGTRQADLVMSLDGFTQRLSLLTGQPGGSNIAVLARSNPGSRTNRPFSITYRYSRTLRFQNGAQGRSQKAACTIDFDHLEFFFTRTRHPTSPAKAYLWVRYACRLKGSRQDFVELAPAVHFRDQSGVTYKARDLDPRPRPVAAVFEVPANTRRGIFYIAGKRKGQTTDTHRAFTYTFTSRRIALSFPR